MGYLRTPPGDKCRQQQVLTNNNNNNNNIAYKGHEATANGDDHLEDYLLSTTNTTTTTESRARVEIPRDAHADTQDQVDKDNPQGQKTYQREYIWLNVIILTSLHLVFVYATLTMFHKQMLYTIMWGLFLGGAGGVGTTGGAHRLWTHRSYKAKWPLRVLLALLFSLAGQNQIFNWVRDHRVHHKYTETDADPHNSNRGFFFAHVGWLMVKKHPEVVRRGRVVDMSDILADPVVQFHSKYFFPLQLIFCWIMPVVVPHYCWQETWYHCLLGPGLIRYVLNLNFTWSVNSFAHIWGNKPFDRRIGPADNLAVSIVAAGEGWHNYHHVFPWDYKTSELGNYTTNVTTFWIDVFAKLGLAYDLKAPSPELIAKVAARYGDGSHPVYGGHVQEVPPPEDEDGNHLQ